LKDCYNLKHIQQGAGENTDKQTHRHIEREKQKHTETDNLSQDYDYKKQRVGERERQDDRDNRHRCVPADLALTFQISVSYDWIDCLATNENLIIVVDRRRCRTHK